MAHTNFNLRGLSPEIMGILKDRAKQQDKSVNSFILKLIENGIGYQPSKNILYHDLDALAGTWSKQDLKEFNKNATYFESIDKDLWE